MKLKVFVLVLAASAYANEWTALQSRSSPALWKRGGSGPRPSLLTAALKEHATSSRSQSRGQSKSPTSDEGSSPGESRTQSLEPPMQVPKLRIPERSSSQPALLRTRLRTVPESVRRKAQTLRSEVGFNKFSRAPSKEVSSAVSQVRSSGRSQRGSTDSSQAEPSRPPQAGPNIAPIKRRLSSLSLDLARQAEREKLSRETTSPRSAQGSGSRMSSAASVEQQFSGMKLIAPPSRKSSSSGTRTPSVTDDESSFGSPPFGSPFGSFSSSSSLTGSERLTREKE